jgi:hypothetical protein
MTHRHSSAFDPDCWECQAWADRIDPPGEFRSILSRPGRVAPLSSRIVGYGAPHEEGCRCALCSPPPRGMPLAIRWLGVQLWCWTPVGQCLYWTVAAVTVRLYP